jgi:propionyl-CoA carboxylase alpha chain
MRRLLVANRGEIARRITRSAREYGLEVVAVYAASDADAPHVREADLAIALRGATAAETYLSVEQLLDAARRGGADAVHPGYGFLSERAELATAVQVAGLTWVGPPPEVIDRLGNKLSAKAMMAAAGVPVLPTWELGDDQQIDVPAGLAFPLLIKAAAGGGGKGMHIVRQLSELEDAVGVARREAAAYFGDATVFVEPYLPDARHIEVQILADQFGDVIHCFERDCSIQRRYQKIIEEAPAPELDEGLRRTMGATAVVAAQAAGYQGAGTVEFVVDGSGDFWFLEVNTRLQVEHPVTEAITGLDLVREQLHIADGFPLSVRQEDLAARGHAIEARVYAEDPAIDFLPATGTLLEWEPPLVPAVRWDAGVETGTVVGTDWDPLLAKVIAHAPTRTEAALRLALALSRLRVRGVVTNRDFLVGALRHPEFLAGRATTQFVARTDVASSRRPEPSELALAATAATLSGVACRRAASRVLPTHGVGWHTGVLPPARRQFRFEDQDITVIYQAQRNGTYVLRVEGPLFDEDPEFSAPRIVRVMCWELESLELDVNGVRTTAHVALADQTWWVMTVLGDLALAELPTFPEPEAIEVAGGLLAPMPGRVIAVAIEEGSDIAAGDVLVIIEAMKMEHRITAPRDGRVTHVAVSVGDQVSGGDVVIVIDEEVT